MPLTARTPVQLVTGVDPEATAATAAALLLDLPDAVAVHHDIDVERSVLRRVVSDLDGVVEEAEIDLAHACVGCAVREDVVPTLERVAASGRWRNVVTHLPLGAEAHQVCHVLAWDAGLARRLRVAAVVAAVDGPAVEQDLLGPDLLADRGRHSSDDDRRGVGEVAAAMVEYADVVVTRGTPSPAGRELLGALARPDVPLVVGAEHVDGAALSGHLHRHDRTLAWTSVVPTGPLPRARFEHVWRLELVAGLPFHPERLLDGLPALGTGRHRSRGCFWLPTRPERALEWDGAGGQLSIGDAGAWGDRTPRTRLLVVGLGRPPVELAEAFRALLLAPDEAAGTSWSGGWDGFEPWLGPVRRAA